ncbi:TPA: hypothetical protein DCR49_02695 [Candidatus Delongbacteria bacterium]|nr:MAG: hypothetical protein A2Y39_01320 [Candidatus Delongbacteria bacterium GWF2_40_14]HAQ60903.1 hypothetical protein [Candidatus Delongbacteria bacterium]
MDVSWFVDAGIFVKQRSSGGGDVKAEFRYSAEQTVTVYSKNIDAVRKVSGEIAHKIRDRKVSRIDIDPA